MYNKFKGTGVAIVTPFHNYGTIDFNSFTRVIEHVVTNGVDYIVAMGTTGESATLSKDEKQAVINFVGETVNKRIPVVVGMGGNNTQEIINTIKITDFEGIDGILSVCPYYNKPQQKGIYNHYKAISGACPVPVILYNVPGRTNCNMTAETTLKIAHDFKNIIGVKEASGDLNQIMKIIRDRPDDFLVISGDDALTLPLLALGADGVISVVANAFPREFSSMVSYGLKTKMKKAKEIHYLLLDVIDDLFADGNPAGIKAALEILGISTNNLRLPLVRVNKAVHNSLAKSIETFQDRVARLDESGRQK